MVDLVVERYDREAVIPFIVDAESAGPIRIAYTVISGRYPVLEDSVKTQFGELDLKATIIVINGKGEPKPTGAFGTVTTDGYQIESVEFLAE